VVTAGSEVVRSWRIAVGIDRGSLSGAVLGAANSKLVCPVDGTISQVPALEYEDPWHNELQNIQT